MGILKSFMKSYNTLAVPLKSSYWTQCPTLCNTVTLNLPCICAMVNSLSSLYFSAVTRIFGMWMPRKHWDNPLNHPSQYFYVSLRSIFHTNRFLSLSYYYLSCEGIDTRADYSFLIWFAWMLHNVKTGLPPLDCRFKRFEVFRLFIEYLIHKR